eukprot:COSAG02_NODE_381_length_23450_cov_65.782493_6_plen_79_part_00
MLPQDQAQRVRVQGMFLCSSRDISGCSFGVPELLPFDTAMKKLSFAVIGPNAGCDPTRDPRQQEIGKMCDAQLNSTPS